jgi:hypothetical protein
MKTIDTSIVNGPYTFDSIQNEAEKHLKELNTLERSYVARKIAAIMLYGEEFSNKKKVEHFMFWETGIMCSIDDIIKYCKRTLDFIEDCQTLETYYHPDRLEMAVSGNK